MLVCKLKNSTMEYTSVINKSRTLRTNKGNFVNKVEVDTRQTQETQTQNPHIAVLFQSGGLISIITVTMLLLIVNVWQIHYNKVFLDYNNSNFKLVKT